MNKNIVLLINPDSLSPESHHSPYMQLSSLPQLGLLYLAAKLREAGFEPVYIDTAIRDVSIQSVFSLIASSRVLFVGFYSNIGLRQETCRFIVSIKKKYIAPVIVGGPGFFEAEHYLNAGADAVVGGEAEDIIVPIAEAIRSGKSLCGIPGVVHGDDIKKPTSPLAPPISDLDRLPQPAWDLAPPYRLKNYLGFYTRHPFYVVLASRGCPMRCAFCDTNTYNKKTAYRYRMRSVESVFKEIKALHRLYKIKHIKFQDEYFGANHDWMNRFCQKMIASKLSVKWSCFMHPLFFQKDPELILSMMKKAGCLSVHFGLQSADPDILKRINRSPEEPQLLLKLIPIMKRLGYYTIIDFIYGLPGETRQTMKDNLRFALRSRVHMILITPLMVVPGSELYDQYGDRPVTDLTPEEIHSAITQANKTFFSQPRIYLESLVIGLKNNPRFFFNPFKLLPLLVKTIVGRLPLIQWTQSRVIGYYNKNK